MHDTEVDTRKRHVAVIVALAAFALLPFIPALLSSEVFTFRDHSDYFVPLRYFTVLQMKSGTIPLWNPYNGSGEPWLANPQSAVFYPPAWIFLILPFATAYVLYLAMHVALFAIGSFLLYRRWSTPSAAFLAALMLALGGPTISLLDVSNNLTTVAWLPWVFFAAARASDTNGGGSFLPGAAAIALSFMAGEPYLAAIGASGYALLVLVRIRFPVALRHILMVALFAVCLSAVHLLPFLDMLRQSDRVVGMLPSESLRQSIHPLQWLSTVVPSLLGAGSQGYIPSLYLGPWLALGLAGSFLALKGDPRRRVTACWLLVLSGAIFLAAGRFNIVLSEFPWLGGMTLSRYPARLASVAALALSALCAIGLDQLRIRDTRLRMAAGATATMFVVIALVVASRHPAGLSPIALRAAVAAFFTIIVFTLVPQVLDRAHTVLLFALILAITSMVVYRPLLLTSKMESSVPLATLVPSDRKLVRLLGSVRGSKGEVPASLLADRRAWIAGYLNLMDRRFDAQTASPLRNASHERLLDGALRLPRSDVLRFLSAGYFLAPEDLEVQGLEWIGRWKGVSLYRDPGSFPMFQIWKQARSVSSDSEAVMRILEGARIDQTLLVTKLPDRVSEALSAARVSKSERLRVAKFDLHRIVADVSLATPAVVTLNQIDANGWKVLVDGKSAESLRANGMFRAVFIPAGVHRVEWIYRPGTFIAGSIFSVGGWMAFLLWSLRRRFSAGAPE